MARGFNGSSAAFPYGVGTTDAISTALTTHATARTYSVWVWRSSFTDSTDIAGADENNQRVWRKGTTAMEELLWDASGGTANFFFRYARTWTTGGSWYFVRPAFKTWVHLALTYDGGSASNAPLVYYDNVSQTVTLLTAATGTIQTNTDPYILGNVPAANRGWDGMQAEFAVWDRILTAGEITALAKRYSPLFFPASLVEYVPMIRDNISRKNAAPTITGTAVQPHPPIIYPSRSLRTRWQQASGTASYFNKFPKPLLRQPLTQGRLL